MLQELKIELKDINYSYFDTYSVLLDIIRNPASYGSAKRISLSQCSFKFCLKRSGFCLPNVFFFCHFSGFVDAKAACCGLGNLNAEAFCLPVSKYCSNRRDHVFWDKFHPTEAASSILVDNIFDGPLQYSYPFNVKRLISL